MFQERPPKSACQPAPKFGQERKRNMRMTNLQRVEILRASCCIAHADGEVSAAELQQLKKIAHAMGVGDASLQAMMDRAGRDPEFYKTQFGVLRDEPLVTIDILMDCVLADGEFRESELGILKALAERLGVADKAFQEQVRQSIAKYRDKAGQ
jgi:uncharacterized tellurite resistance protein B-like protein